MTVDFSARVSPLSNYLTIALATREAYRARLRSDKEAVENFTVAQNKRFILREERTFLEVVEATFELPAKR